MKKFVFIIISACLLTNLVMCTDRETSEQKGNVLTAMQWHSFLKSHEQLVEKNSLSAVNKENKRGLSIYGKDNILYGMMNNIDKFMENTGIEDTTAINLCDTVVPGDTATYSGHAKQLSLVDQDILVLRLAYTNEYCDIVSSFLKKGTFGVSEKDVIYSKKLRDNEKLRLLVVMPIVKKTLNETTGVNWDENGCEYYRSRALKGCADDLIKNISMACGSYGNPQDNDKLERAIGAAISQHARCQEITDSLYKECLKQ